MSETSSHELSVRRILAQDNPVKTVSNQDRFLRAYASGKDSVNPRVPPTERLTPLVKRRVFHIPASAKIGVGWAQLPRLGGDLIALGVFSGRDRFSQVALADWHGRVFLAPPRVSEANGLSVDFTFLPERASMPAEKRGRGAERRSSSPAARLLGRLLGSHARHANPARAAFGMASNPMASMPAGMPEDTRIHGAMLSSLDAPDDDPRWVASWTQEGDRYTLHEMKMPLPQSLRRGLSYRDAVAIGFFGAGYLPLVVGYPQGYGSGAVFRILREQAPMAALRNTMGVITSTALAGYKVSGLDRFFLSLPSQLDMLSGRFTSLMPRHGLEPLSLTTSAYSHAFQLHTRASRVVGPGQSQGGLDMVGEFEALRLESAFNRFSLLSAILETNAITGRGPVEESADEKTVGRMDRCILNNPVLTALPVPRSLLWRGQRNAFDSEGDSAYAGSSPTLCEYLKSAMSYAQGTTIHLLQGERKAGRPAARAGEWAYRQSLSRLYEMLRLPIRLDVDFRSALENGNVAVEMGAVEAGLLPSLLFAGGHYIKSSRQDRKALATRESLQEGLLLAALAFGASQRVKKVTLLISDNRLTQFVEQRSAQPGPGLLDQLHLSHHSVGKGEAKDRDRHGDPETTPIVPGDGLNPGERDGKSREAGSQPGKPGEKEGDQKSGSAQKTGSAKRTPTDGSPAAPARSQALSQIAHVLSRAAQGRSGPQPARLVTVTFTRSAFKEALDTFQQGRWFDLLSFYKKAGAVLRSDGNGGLLPAPSQVSLRDLAYTPTGAQEEPEAAQRDFDRRARRDLAAKDSLGLSIQREEVLETAVDYVTQLRRDEESGRCTSVQAAKKATAFLNRIADPELEGARESLIRALIDETAVPDVRFKDEQVLHSERLSLLRGAMRGVDPAKAVNHFEQVLSRYDERYRRGPGVPRFFNSYAERVVYNHLFATPGERTLIIPDDLFYGHLLLADVYGNNSEQQESLRHLNRAVSYAPTYAMAHLRQSVQFARSGDWTSARAACLNALNVAVDRLDAGYAYYRLAFAEWQLDRLPAAAACYKTALDLGQDANGALPGELSELSERMHSQGMSIPESPSAVRSALTSDSIVVWPEGRITKILSQATHVTVDEGMFIPARTIARASTRVSRSLQGGIDMVQARFLNSLEA